MIRHSMIGMSNIRTQLNRPMSGISSLRFTRKRFLSFKDPMAGMSKEEIQKHKKEIRSLTRKTFSIAYGIMGGGMTIVVINFYKNQGIYIWSQSGKRSTIA